MHSDQLQRPARGRDRVPRRCIARSRRSRSERNVDGYASYREVMSTWRPKACRDCGLPGGDDVKISRQGYCSQCGMTRALAAAREMITRTGPHYERFVLARHPTGPKAIALGVGGTPGPIDNERTNQRRS